MTLWTFSHTRTGWRILFKMSEIIPGPGYSCTSNTVKLYKHLDTLALLQKGIVIPIMIHIIPTHRCNMNCAYCCFKNRKDKKRDLPLNILKEGIMSFHKLGTRSVEFTGGGDPTLYPYINEALEWLHDEMKMNIGFITNTVDTQLVKYWKYCSWVRVSFNTMDYRDMNLGPIRDAGIPMTGCYIWNEKSTLDAFDKVVNFAEKEEIVCRVGTDCIKSSDEIDASMDMLKEVFKKYQNKKFVFLSDFNITTGRSNFNCYFHMIKPCFYVDGYIYSCPSAELAYENDHQVPKSIRVCKYDEIIDFYQGGQATNKTYRDCSYCKYFKQQVVLEEVLTETTFNEFA